MSGFSCRWAQGQTLTSLKLGFKSADPVLSDTDSSPSFYQIDPQDTLQCMGLVRLLHYFQWNWIGIVASDDDNGENFIRSLTPILAQHDICVTFTERPTPELFLYPILTDERYKQVLAALQSNAQVAILSGDSNVIQNFITSVSFFEEQTHTSLDKVWILTSEWEFAVEGFQYQWWSVRNFHALSFTVHTGAVPGFQSFLRDLDPYHPQGDVFLPDWWEVAFNCEVQKSGQTPEEGRRICTGEEKLEILPASVFEGSMAGHSYTVYNAVYSVAHALHAACSRSQRGLKWDSKKSLLNVKPWQVQFS
ncbi:vomeronasal type-2 receptor 1-like isoform X2 [Hemicordylus capensis]|uniref:vomeronasal type-2 receptor 1-like isoform X2 n=1 Tax=Hemicordylus capensis TaxID=884348 RepID=UPI0023022841|nr:vomeronasal type-2 receptor 1-like isoform X2 [Hemicordylus capensis]